MATAGRLGKSATITGALVALLAGLTCAVTLAAESRPPGPVRAIETVRQEIAVYASTGLYRLDPKALAREGVIWDAVNLVVAVPALALALAFARRGSLRGRLVVMGLSLYFAYVYLMYAVMVALNPLFPAYIAIFALATVTLVAELVGFDTNALASAMSDRFPRRLFVGFAFVLSTLLLLLWGRMIASVLSTGKMPPGLAGMTTLPTQALDLGLVVPLALSSGILLLRRRPLGYLLAALLLTFGFMMCIAIPLWIVVPLVTDGKANLFEALPFLLLCAGGAALAFTFLRNVSPRGARLHGERA